MNTVHNIKSIQIITSRGRFSRGVFLQASLMVSLGKNSWPMSWWVCAVCAFAKCISFCFKFHLEFEADFVVYLLIFCNIEFSIRI